MAKVIRKILFGDLFNTLEYEECFSEMSRKGLHLKKIGRCFAYFEEGEPNYLNYKIDIVNKDEEKKEIRIRQYKRRGWDFISERYNFLVFSSPLNSGVEELYENPEDQKLELEDIKKEIFGGGITSIILIIISILLLILMLYERTKSEGGFYLLLTKDELIITIILTLLPLFKEMRRKLSFKKFEKSLDIVESFRYGGDYLLMRNKFIIRKSIYYFIILFIIFSMIYKVSEDKSINLSEIEDIEALPVISIKDIETMDYSLDESSYRIIKDDIDYGNHIYKSWNILIPEEYSLIETAFFEDSSPSELNPRLTIDYYLGRFDNISEGLEKDIRFREEKRESSTLYKIQEEDGYTFYGLEKEDLSIVICRSGKQIVLVKYYDGTASLEDIVEAIIKKLEL